MGATQLQVRKIAVRTGLGIFAVQLSMAAGLMVADRLRVRRDPPEGFEHGDTHEPVKLENSTDVVTIYSRGAELFPAMLADIAAAEHSIFVETYIWKDDEFGRDLVAALERKAREGVDVFVMFDWFANVVVPREFKRFPEAMHTLVFRPVNTPLGMLKLSNFTRDHRKLLVIDGRVGYCGGFNIGSIYTTWRDTQVRIEGESARELEYAFADMWNANRTPDLPQVDRGRLADWNPTLDLHRNDPYLRIFPIRGLYLEAISRAGRRVWLTHAYFVPDRALRAKLMEAARKGVDVQLLLPWRSNHVVADWLARRRFAELLEAGVRIFAYQDVMIHAKTAVVDSMWSTVGSTNMDRMSMLGNYESNVEIHSQVFAAEMERMFETDKANSVEIAADWWRSRPFLAKVTERVLEGLAPHV